MLNTLSLTGKKSPKMNSKIQTCDRTREIATANDITCFQRYSVLHESIMQGRALVFRFSCSTYAVWSL